LRDVFVKRLCLTSFGLFLVWGCDGLDKPGDTPGEQASARWEWRGKLVVEHDSSLTLTRLRIDTAGVPDRHDVILARFDFDPGAGAGDEFALTLGLDLGVARDLPIGEPLGLGPPPARIPAYGTVTRLGTPLRTDSVRGTFVLGQRGLRSITGRVDARFYLTAWGDSAAHTTYELHQKIFGVK
jgi:hypothetical protein